MRLAAVVPAAGLSRRMGAFKPLLPLYGKPALCWVVDSLLRAGVRQIALVSGYRSKEVTALFQDARVLFVQNDAYESTGMLESVQCGLSALSSYDAVFVLPGDMPAVRSETITRLAEAGAAAPGKVIRPTYGGRPGHPPLLTHEVAKAALHFQGEGGLRALLSSYLTDSVFVETNDPGCLLDLDDQEDIERFYTLSNERSW